MIDEYTIHLYSHSNGLVLVIDTSGSMQNKGRIGQAKTAAKWVINTLSLYVVFGNHLSDIFKYKGVHSLIPHTFAIDV